MMTNENMNVIEIKVSGNNNLNNNQLFNDLRK